MANNVMRAQELEMKAEKTLKGGILSKIFPSGTILRNEEAGELFTKAANVYKQMKDHESAARTFRKAAACAEVSGNRYESATAMVLCAKQEQAANSKELAAQTLSRAIEIFCDEGRFHIAAKHQRDVAELYEASNDTDEALAAYEKAGDLFSGENATSSANACLLKVADITATRGDYDRAIQLYEQVSRESLNNNLLRPSVKEYFFRAVLCHMANEDYVAATEAIDTYGTWEPSFTSSRIAKFLEVSIEALNNNDADSLTDAIVEFDSITKFDAWKTSMLLKCKRRLTANESTHDDQESSGGLA